MKRTLTALVALLLSSTPEIRATALRVTDVKLLDARGTAPRVEAAVRWENAWRSQRNHDAAWVFVKLRQGQVVRHARLAAAGHRVEPAPGGVKGSLDVPSDRTGAFVAAALSHRGPAAFRLSLALDAESFGAFDEKEKTPIEALVWGIEMVFIPEGAFTLGDPAPEAMDFGVLYKAGQGGVPEGVFEIASEKAFEVGAYRDRLDYRARDPQYQGDRLGPVPDGFPKGFRAFWLMKYELTQGQYADFLNTLNHQSTYFRAIHGGAGYAKERGSIELRGDRYAALHPDRPANYVSWDDGAAFADWAGLRPYTELEFEKACRGPEPVRPGMFPWGTSSREKLKRRVRPDDDLETAGEADESRLADDTRDVLGASYYWVMDLAGSVWERTVTIGHPLGRAFRGTNGDGRLDGFGFATNDDWPKGDVGRGGYGYRGGGYYEQGMKEGEFNPWSPIGYRRYGAWGDAPRSIAYGFRAARSVEQNAPAAR
jgi:formylglycine-generating enzyme required for sulfatase activity